MFTLSDLTLKDPEAPVGLSSGSKSAANKPAYFLRGPIPWAWLRAATAEGLGALASGIALHHFKTLRKTGEVKTNAAQLAVVSGLSAKVVRQGLQRLEAAGLVSVKRPSGCGLRVTINGCPIASPQALPLPPESSDRCAAETPHPTPGPALAEISYACHYQGALPSLPVARTTLYPPDPAP